MALRSKDFTIRRATVDDMREVARMIKEYATNDENIPEGPQLSCKELIHDGFEIDAPMYQCIVAQMCGGPVIGYAVYFPTYSSWLGKTLKLEDLFVRTAHRRKGVGSALFNAVAKEAMLNMACRLDFYVIKNSPAVPFYQDRGAVDLTTCGKWLIYSLRGDALALAAAQAC